MPTSGNIVRVKNVHKFFTRGNETVDVLNDLSLDVPEGEFLALMGPSGSGKTTLLNLIAGLDRPSQGEVWVGAEKISKMSEAQLARWRTRNIGFVFQFYHLLSVMTAFENVELPLLLLPLSASQRKRQVNLALDLVGLNNRSRHRPGQLSGGQQQRVGIARAIVTDPVLIVADEPTGDLDAKSADEILDLLCELRAAMHKTIVLVTHDARAAQRAHRVQHLDKGRLVSSADALASHQFGPAPRKLTMIKYFLLIAKNLRRNVLRTTLTALGTMVLVLVVTLIWSVLALLDSLVAEKNSNLKAIVTERWQIPSQMPFAYASKLAEGAAREPGDVRPQDSMSWQFFGGALAPNKRAREDLVFAFAMEPKKLATMMDDLDTLPPAEARELAENIRKMESKRNAIVIGPKKLAQIHKQVGERIKLYSLNFKDIDLEFEIVGMLPDGRYKETAAFNRDYLNAALDNYPRTHAGKKHPMADKSLNLMWVRVANADEYSRLADQLARSPLFGDPAVKCETASSGIASFLEAYKDMIWGLRWLLAPAILVTLSLVISNAISISVRERRLEMAVLKVLGFQPRQLLILVLGEALLIGVLAGVVSAGATYFIVNNYFGGVAFPIAFIPVFYIPPSAIWWGLIIGTCTSLAGSIMPAWSARTVKVSDVFSKVA